MTATIFASNYDYTSEWEAGYTDTLVTKDKSAFICHGVLMLFVWLFCVPLGIFLIRQEKAHRYSVFSHQFLVTIGIVSTLTLFAQMLAAAAGTQFTQHGKYAVAVICLILVEIPVGFLINWHLRKDRFRNQGVILKYVHKIVGPVLWSLALGTSRRGIHLLTGGTDWHIPTHVFMDVVVVGWFLLYTYICALGLHHMRKAAMEAQGDDFTNWKFFSDYVRGKQAFVTMEYYRNASKKDDSESELSKSIPTFTMTEIADSISRGNHLIILDRMVVDVRRFVKSHPGGRQILLSRVGLDCTTQFKAYGHSLKSWKIANSLCVGMMADDRSEENFYSYLTLRGKEPVNDGAADGSAEGVEEPSFIFSFDIDRAQNVEEFGHVFVFHAFCPEFDTIVERKYFPFKLERTSSEVIKAHFLIKVYKHGIMGDYLNNMTLGSKIRAYTSMEMNLFRNPVLEHDWKDVVLFCEGHSIVSVLRNVEFFVRENNNVTINLFHYLSNPADESKKLLDRYQFSKVTQSFKIGTHEDGKVFGYSLMTLLDFLEITYSIVSEENGDLDDDVKQGDGYGLQVEIETVTGLTNVVGDNNCAASNRSGKETLWIPPRAHQTLQDLGLIMIAGRSPFCSSIRQSLYKLGIPDSKVVITSW
eukprot:TRINITY_DN4886_c1_g1_i1.p1 TRINITY_DN4886_c1_g1~~TRINITY_DN4886_c1_g1_i1.p1  ORF type:complete len:679 (-),score=156.47 TRINITY_DN4886_c1_g1_i1:131-2056(-)